MASARRSRIYVIAGVNGAGKSTIGAATFRELGADYYNKSIFMFGTWGWPVPN